MTVQHTKIESNEDIPDLCKSMFLSNSKFLGMVWVMAGLLMTGSGSCIAWAMTTNSSIVELKQAQMAQESQLKQLQSEINDKLNILIKRQ